MTMAHDAEIHTLAAPYAVHALPPEEVELFERHLSDCSACRAEIDAIRETSARLGQAESVVPPPEMKSGVMARISKIRPLPPIAAPTPEPADARTWADRWRHWWPRLSVAVAASLAAVAIVLGAQLADVREDLDRTQAIGEEMSQLVAAPDVEVVRAAEGDSTGTVVMARSLDTAVLVADGMDPAPEDHTYQLWTITDGEMASAGLLGTTDDGQLGPFTADGLANATQLGVTVEPAGGSEQPTTDPVMVIDLPTV